MCEWCGHQHDVRALCGKRPTWGRRGFIAMLGAAAVGAIVPRAIPIPIGEETVGYIEPMPVVDLSKWGGIESTKAVDEAMLGLVEPFKRIEFTAEFANDHRVFERVAQFDGYFSDELTVGSPVTIDFNGERIKGEIAKVNYADHTYSADVRVVRALPRTKRPV